MHEICDKPRYMFHWIDHAFHVNYAINNYTPEQFGMCSIVVEGDHAVTATKIKLAACSRYFKNVFAENDPEVHINFFLPNISSTILHNVLDYVHSGVSYVDEDNLREFYDVVEWMEMKGFVDQHQTEEPNVKHKVIRVHMPQLIQDAG